MGGVLDGIRVLDFGRYIAGPYCAALLGDLGADVIRIEKRSGGEDRYLMPVIPGEKGTQREGALFLQMNRNKRGMTLDPMTPEGRKLAHRLVETADVVVANLPEGTLRDMGLDYATLSAVNPRIVVTTVSAFGNGGPYSDRVGFDGVAQAMSGGVYMTGEPGSPTRSAVSWVDFGTASLAAFGTMAALFQRGKTGKGQLVEGALLGTALTYYSPFLIEQAALGLDRAPTGNRGQTAGPSDIVACKDGHIIVLVNGDPIFRRFARLVGRPGLLEDQRFATDELRGDNGEALSEALAAWAANLTTAEALAALEKARVPGAPVYAPRQTLDDPHVRAMGFFQPLGFPGLAQGAGVAVTPVRLSAGPGTLRTRAPLLGEHTAVLLAELGLSAADQEALAAAGAI
jgi:crotonobetainyl-CoA:carnitine CoA-transferase CaiB-like acyl-CoA transferase